MARANRLPRDRIAHLHPKQLFFSSLLVANMSKEAVYV